MFDAVKYSTQKHDYGAPGMQKKWNDASIVVQNMYHGSALHKTKGVVSVGNRAIPMQFLIQHVGSS